MTSLALVVSLLGGCSDPGIEAVLADAPQGAFLSVWGPTNDDVWVVGGQPQVGAILRGSAERGFVSQSVPSGTPILNWVHGTSAEDVWVGGIAGTVLHWDGAAWTDHSLDIDEAIWGLYARAKDDVWLVGGTSRWGGERGVVFHYDGNAFVPWSLPSEFGTVSNLFKVHPDGERMWVVGAGGAAALERDGVLVAAPTGVSQDLVTANLGTAERMVVVGGRGTGLVFVEDGDRLTQIGTAPAGLNGVVGEGERAIIVGENGYLASVDLGSGELHTHSVPTTDILHAVWRDSDDRIYAVGGNLGTAAPTFHGVIVSGDLPESP